MSENKIMKNVEDLLANTDTLNESDMRTDDLDEFQIRWEDLTTDAQKALLEFYGITDPSEMNWDIFPVETLYK